MFLANENIPFPSIKLLRSQSISVEAIAENNAGSSDEKVVQIALEKGLIIITQDSDYGKILFLNGSTFTKGVVYFRNIFSDPKELGQSLIDLLNSNIILEGKFTTVDKNQIRQRTL